MRFVIDLLNSQKFRYMVIGGVNTAFGYLTGVAIYEYLVSSLNIWMIGVVSNILAITFSFVTYKLFVFKTKGKWIAEYIRAYVVYGGVALVGVLLLWVYVVQFGLPIWIAQAFVIISTVAVSYVGHSRLTFRRNEL